MTWWQNLFNIKKEEPVHPRTGMITSPEFINGLKREGYWWNKDRFWWMRVWTTAVPYKRYPIFREVWETYEFDDDNEVWSYKIVNPYSLGGTPNGSHGPGWLIWQDKNVDVDKIVEGYVNLSDTEEVWNYHDDCKY
tara:strand:- start:124 stop:531 length:408 start_codon:yes stop_codon:yes gene_type:complete